AARSPGARRSAAGTVGWAAWPGRRPRPNRTTLRCGGRRDQRARWCRHTRKPKPNRSQPEDASWHAQMHAKCHAEISVETRDRDVSMCQPPASLSGELGGSFFEERGHPLALIARREEPGERRGFEGVRVGERKVRAAQEHALALGDRDRTHFDDR